MPPRVASLALIFTFLCLPARAWAAQFALYRSVDDGHTWTLAGKGIPVELRTDALGEVGTVRLAGTERGLFRSTDDGATWTRPRQGVPETVKVTDFAVVGGRAYAASARGVWTSADQGDSWAPAGPELADSKVLSLAVVGGRVWAGTDRRGAWRLSESGAVWEDLSTGLPATAQLFQLAVQHGTVFAALYVQGVYRFDPVGARWVATADERPLRLVAAGETLFAGRNPGGVFTSRDGGATWLDTSTGLIDNAPTWQLASRGDTVLIGTRGPSSLLRYDELARTWKPSDLGLPDGWSAIAFGLGEKSALVSVISAESGRR